MTAKFPVYDGKLIEISLYVSCRYIGLVQQFKSVCAEGEIHIF
jgi:hypothetical protein